MSMKSVPRISKNLLRVAPALLLTLAYAGVAQAQPAPVITLGNPCPAPPTNRIYRIATGTTPGASTNPRILSSTTAAWTASAAGAGACTAAGSGFVCAGLSVTMPTSADTQTPDFTGTASSSATSQFFNATVTVGANSCSA